MRVLVTGGCGLIGYHACMYYKNMGHEVVAMDNLERSKLLGHEVSDDRHFFNKRLLNQAGVETWLLDVSVRENWQSILYNDVRSKKLRHEQFDLVIHLAGQCGVPTSIANPTRDWEVNANGTLHALEYCREVGATLCLASTNKVYPIHDDPKHPTWIKDIDNRWRFLDLRYRYGIKEDADFKGARTPYGNSKMAADMLCQEWSHTYGIRTGVFRMSCIYGPNQFGFEEQGWATWFVIAAIKNLPITIYGDGCQVRDMLYVEDCVRAYDAFVSSDRVHGVYNLGGGPGFTLTLNEHLDFLERRIGRKAKEITFAEWRPLDQKAYISNITKIQNELGWTPTISPEEGLEKVIDWVGKNQEVF